MYYHSLLSLRIGNSVYSCIPSIYRLFLTLGILVNTNAHVVYI